MTRKRDPIGFIPPILRIPLVIVITTAFLLIHDLKWGTAAAGGSLIVFAWISRRRYWHLLAAMCLINTAFMTLGNWLFSPERIGSHSWLFFRVNSDGLRLGLIGALKRDAMIILSLAWLSSGNATGDAAAFVGRVPLPLVRKYFAVFLRLVVNFKQDLEGYWQSARVRGIVGHRFHVARALFGARLVLTATVQRMFRFVGVSTYTGECHFCRYRTHLLGQTNSVETADLSASYEPASPNAINRVSLRLLPGDVVCLLGPTGSGKSTLLRAIAGWIPRIEGEVRNGHVFVKGEDASELDLCDWSGRVRYVGSSHRENLLGLTVRGELSFLASSPASLEDYLAKLGLSQHGDRYTDELSGGQQARLSLASALATQVPCLLFDAPLAQLDLWGRREFMEALKSVSLGARIVVIADDDLDSVLPVANRFVLLRDGNVENDLRGQFETQDELFARLGRAVPAFRLPRSLSANNPHVVAELRGISVTRGDVVILENLSLCVYERECLVVVGRNGSGKTSAMLALAGIATLVRGQRIPVNLKCGYVFQNAPTQILGITCREELEIGPRLADWEDEARQEFVARGLERIQTQGARATLDLGPSEARALACVAATAATELVIFDEPTNEMDAEEISRFGDLVCDLHHSGVATVIVTHDLRLLELASRIIIMERGRIMTETTDSREVYAYYAAQA